MQCDCVTVWVRQQRGASGASLVPHEQPAAAALPRSRPSSPPRAAWRGGRRRRGRASAPARSVAASCPTRRQPPRLGPPPHGERPVDGCAASSGGGLPHPVPQSASPCPTCSPLPCRGERGIRRRSLGQPGLGGRGGGHSPLKHSCPATGPGAVRWGEGDVHDSEGGGGGGGCPIRQAVLQRVGFGAGDESGGELWQGEDGGSSARLG